MAETAAGGAPAAPTDVVVDVTGPSWSALGFACPPPPASLLALTPFHPTDAVEGDAEAATTTTPTKKRRNLPTKYTPSKRALLRDLEVRAGWAGCGERKP